MSTQMLLNGADMQAVYGFRPQGPLRWVVAQAKTPIVNAWDRIGGFASTTEITSGILQVQGVIVQEDHADRITAEEALAAALYGGAVELDRASSTTRRTTGYLDGTLGIQGEFPAFTSRVSRVSFNLACPEATWFETSDTTVTMPDATPVAWAIGSAPVAPVITITGATNPTVTIKDSDAVTQAALSFGAFATGGDDLIINCATGEIIFDDGSPARVFDELTAGIFPFRLLRRWGEGTITLSSGTGTMVYAKRYW